MLSVTEISAGSVIPGTWILCEDDFAQIEYQRNEFRRYYIRVHETDDGHEFHVIVDERFYEPCEWDEFRTIDFWQDSPVGYASTLLGAWKLIFEDCNEF